MSGSGDELKRALEMAEFVTSKRLGSMKVDIDVMARAISKLHAVVEAAQRAIDNTPHSTLCVVDGRLLCTCWQQDVQLAIDALTASEGEK